MSKVIYNKANSLGEIRGIKEKKDFVVNHLSSLYNEESSLAGNDPLRHALDDLFNANKELTVFKINLDHSTI